MKIRVEFFVGSIFHVLFQNAYVVQISSNYLLDICIFCYWQSIATMVLQYLEDGQISEVLKELTDSASASSWTTKHGSVLAISSILRHKPSIVYASPLFTVVVNSLRSTLKDEKVLLALLCQKFQLRYLTIINLSRKLDNS